MRKVTITIIIMFVCLLGITGCNKKSNNKQDPIKTNNTSQTTTMTTSLTNVTTTSNTTTTKKVPTSKKTKDATVATLKKNTQAEEPVSTFKPECDANNAEFVAYVENYKKTYASKGEYFAKVEPYTIFFYTKTESDAYSSYASRLGYGYDGTSIPYENSTCKVKLYTIALVIREYKDKKYNPIIYVPATSKKDLVSAENYLKQQGLI